MDWWVCLADADWRGLQLAVARSVVFDVLDVLGRCGRGSILSRELVVAEVLVGRLVRVVVLEAVHRNAGVDAMT